MFDPVTSMRSVGACACAAVATIAAPRQCATAAPRRVILIIFNSVS
jgi:hypothetical protein